MVREFVLELLVDPHFYLVRRGRVEETVVLHFLGVVTRLRSTFCRHRRGVAMNSMARQEPCSDQPLSKRGQATWGR